MPLTSHLSKIFTYHYYFLNDVFTYRCVIWTWKDLNSRPHFWRSIKTTIVLIISEFPTHGSDARTASLETGTDLIRPLRGYVLAPCVEYTCQLKRHSQFLLRNSAPPLSSRLMDERKGNLNFTCLLWPYVFKLNYIKRNHNNDAELPSAYLYVCLVSERYETASIKLKEWPTWCTLALFYNTSTTILYMFQALHAHHQEAKLHLCSIWYRLL